MITTPTVLILGAGASVHLGYPLGAQLVERLCQLRIMNELKELPQDWTEDEAKRFLTRLSRSGHYSIDAFLETVPEQSDIGKFLISREFKRHENVDHLFPPHQSGWYQYLFNQLLDNGNAVGFERSRLNVVTFNYDRSLEAYLHEALMARFEMSGVDAQHLLSQIEIVHVHGSIGRYPDVPYSAETDATGLVEISKQIRIIHEVDDQGEGFCAREFELAHRLLTEAERIFILGFGFHPDNIRRLKFFTPENTKGREIFCSTAGMGTIETQQLASRLQENGIRPEALNGTRCNAFFSHFAALH
ncbi:MAG: hypothetical protein ACE5GF_04500 [Thermodesulfobacteriota bacterium]